MTQSAGQVLRGTLRNLDTRPIEVLYCVLTISWGLSLLWPGDAFASAPSFAPMSCVMADWGWGLVALAIGLVRTYGVFPDLIVARLIASLGGGVIWTFVWSTMLLSHSMSTGVAVYGVLSLVNLLVFVKLCRISGETATRGGHD